MVRNLVLALAAVTTTVGLVATSAGAGATAGKLQLIVAEKGHVMPYPPAGTFTLAAGSKGGDRGATSVAPREVRSGIRDGQSFKVVEGSNTFYGKKGSLVIRFTGVAIDVADATDVEYGTWSIYTAVSTGLYQGWRGGGRWASTSKNARYVVRWEGLVTR